MRKRLFEQTCPWCHASFMIARDTFLIADFGGIDRKRLLDGTYFTHQCSRCGRLFSLMYPVEYRDTEHGFTVILTEEPMCAGKGTTVICRTSAQFVYAVQILSNGLDLAYMIALRKKLEQTARQVRFLDYDPDTNTVWFEKDGKPAGILYNLKPSFPLEPV